MIQIEPLPDAEKIGRLEQWLPSRLRPWFRLARLDRPIGIWLLMFPAWQGVSLAAAMDHKPLDWLLLVKMAVGALVMRSFGCVLNDVVDRKLDAKVLRTRRRPLACGEITVIQALIFEGVLGLLGLLILFSLKPLAIILGFASIGLVGLYPFMKRITWWPQAWLGLTFNWGMLLGFASVDNSLKIPALVFYVGGVFWTLGYDTIYALQDMEDDALAGIKSSARRMGDHVQHGVACFYGFAFLTSFLAGSIGGLGPFFFLIEILYGLHLARQIYQLNKQGRGQALRLFRSNQTAGLILFLAIASQSVF